MQGLHLQELTPEQKIGQMLFCRGAMDQRDFDFLIELVKNRSIGGIHASSRFVRKGIPDLESEDMMIQKILDAADYPVLIGEDVETGFSGVKFMEALDLPHQLALGSADDEPLCYEYGRIGAIQAKSKGYNLVFGPVLDIGMNPESSCVNLRSFGGKKEMVARLAAATIRGYQDQGVIVSAKHYPGFGESPVDNHLEMVYLSGDSTFLLERELYPYTYAMKHADLSGVMTGHIMAPKVDPVYPASLSPKLISLLRSTGYDGLIMTDSLAMVGLTNMFGLEECFRLAMRAGNDMVMGDYRSSIENAYHSMLKAWKDGIIPETQLDCAVSRVIAAQNKTMKKPAQKEISQKEIDSIEEMGRKAISVTLNGVDHVALDRHAKHLFIIQEGNYYLNAETGKIEQESCDLDMFTAFIKEKFTNADFLSIPEFPIRAEIEHAMATSIQYDSVVMVLLNTCNTYTGSADSTKRMLAVLSGLRRKLSAVILFGNPYSAREFGDVKRIIYGYQGKNCQKYAALTLTGEHTPIGKLPVSL